MKDNITIAIDGPAASGKGTLARGIAENLGLAFLDTGALYRAVAKRVLAMEADPSDSEKAMEAAYWLNEFITPALLEDPALRREEISAAAAKVADIPEVRMALLDLQRDFAANPGKGYKGAVLDGRDIGTVICPDADIKLYVSARREVRTGRRLKELQSRGIGATSEAVLRDMEERDARDASRQAAPMKPAADAIVLDTSDMDAAQALEKALEIIKGKAR